MEICLSLSPWCCDLKTRATTLSIRRLLAMRWFLSFTALSQKLFIFSHRLISFGPTLISSGLRIQKGSEGSHQTANLSCTGEKSEVAEQTDKPWLCHREADSLILPGTVICISHLYFKLLQFPATSRVTNYLGNHQC